MAEETKATASSEADDKGTNYVAGNKWMCAQCGMTNPISTWTCRACFASMKKSMQKDKSIRARNKQKEQQVRSMRMKKRDEIKRKRDNNKSPKAKAAAKSKDGDESKTQSKGDESKENETEKKEKEIPRYKISENIPKTMKALVKETEDKGYILKTDYPVPVPAEDELLIRSFAVAICGSDTILYNW
eukprot:CAMPEP_0201572068 /NCGR_PEP_ID=MMETSP0190_2-20130828/15124_1 /ASSEMBLY_ACC=CAM_ASM_000263 /TAXON_ID=37353 /ORGANISM="Rosalina sp." /LENGTH=186 /DNA_ID=CAMNT_0047997381 /DNA_START=149 /DNA_END=706 /DNA_ORIENTATION=-